MIRGTVALCEGEGALTYGMAVWWYDGWLSHSWERRTDMEASNRITSRRALLPQDVQIIESIGITPEEYFDFLINAAEYACANRGGLSTHS